jgi:hypothetical protein
MMMKKKINKNVKAARKICVWHELIIRKHTVE